MVNSLYLIESVAIALKSLYTPRDFTVDGSEIDVRAFPAKNNTPFKKEKTAVARFLLWQVVGSIFSSLMVWFFWNPTAAKSTLLGGLIAVIPNGFLAFYFFMRKHPHPHKMMRDMVVGELLKIVMVGGLFIVALRFFDLALLPFLVGLGSVYAVYFAAQLLMMS